MIGDVVAKTESGVTLPIASGSLLETMPLVLVSLLERRYLNDFRPADWRLIPDDESTTRPLLFEVTSLSQPDRAISSAVLMTQVLSACHEPGHALVLVLQGQSDRQHLYLGARRLAGHASVSTTDHVQSIASAFEANLSGLELCFLRAYDNHHLPRAAGFIETASCFAALTGIPSPRQGLTGPILQGLDRVVRAGGNAQYQIMVVAEPLDPSLVDGILDGMRRLRSEIHQYTRRTRSLSMSETSSGSQTKVDDSKGASSEWQPYLLVGLSLIASCMVGSPHLAALGPAVVPLQSMAFLANARSISRQRGGTTQSTSEGRTSTEAASVELLDANAEACEQLLLQHSQRLQAARCAGWWRTGVYVAAADETSLQRVTGALRGIATGDLTYLDPIRVMRPDAHIMRDAMRYGRLLRLEPMLDGTARQQLEWSLGEMAHAYDSLATCLSSAELGVLFALPQRELPGLPMRERSQFGLTVPDAAPGDVVLGQMLDDLDRAVGPVPISGATLNCNAFVAGITGSGKTNTCMHLLLQAHENLDIPFLVIEPVKTEYRTLAGDKRLRGGLAVFAAGLDEALPLRLNPLQPVPGFPITRHLDLLKAVFNAAFPMFAGMTYVLEEALVEVYADYGWSLRASEEPAHGFAHSEAERAALLPNLHDLYEKIDVVLNRKGYGQEIHANLGAALRSRVHSLLVGLKGVLFDTRRSIPHATLFNRPAVVELQQLSDDDEKAFVISLLFILLCEYAEMRQRDLPTSWRGRLHHLTLIEEAHRLLAPGRGGGSEAGDPRGKAVSMFADLLAELRAYGEGFIIAEQIPTKLTPETLKNTALKVIHRLAAVDDRQVAGGCANLDPLQIRHLNNLMPGQAVVHDATLGDAVLVKVERVALKDNGGIGISENLSGNLDYLHRGGGCERCASPCRYWHGLQRSELMQTAQPGVRGLLDALLYAPEDDKVLTGVLPSRGIWEGNGTAGQVYCALLEAARTHLLGFVTVRNRAVGRRQLSVRDRVTLERGLERMGEVLSKLSRNETVPGSDLQRLANDLTTLFAAEPPAAKPGCGQCPQRCRALALVGDVMDPLATRLSPFLFSSQAAESRRDAFARNAEASFRPPPGLADNAVLKGVWLYCLAVQVTGDRQADPNAEALLTLLRASAFETKQIWANSNPLIMEGNNENLMCNSP